MRTKVRVWDLPTRIFHWALVLCVIGSVATAQLGGAAMVWHFRCGFAILSLLLFRVVWGLIGGQWSRFVSFIYTPKVTLSYLRGQGKPEHSVGHSPIGALSVFALLTILMAQAITGLTSDDEITSAGPLVSFVSNAWVSNSTFYHANVGKFVLLVLLALHVAAIAFYYVKKRQNLVRPMIVGDKEVDASLARVGSKDSIGTRSLALAVFLACAFLVRGLVGLGA